jgi:hypothetical protein
MIPLLEELASGSCTKVSLFVLDNTPSVFVIVTLLIFRLPSVLALTDRT